jgi:hypothetical protein
MVVAAAVAVVAVVVVAVAVAVAVVAVAVVAAVVPAARVARADAVVASVPARTAHYLCSRIPCAREASPRQSRCPATRSVQQASGTFESSSRHRLSASTAQSRLTRRRPWR